MKKNSHIKSHKLYFAVGFIFFSILISSCNPSVGEKNVEKQNTTKSEIFKLQEIPSILSTPEHKADYLLEHYWDNFNFNDTSILNKPKISEQQFVNFINILLQLQSEKADKGVVILMKKAETNEKMYKYFFEQSEKYLYDPNSPMRNEGIYESFLKVALSSNAIDDTHKIRPRKQFDLAQKNKPEQKATDFKFTLRNGSSSRLYSVQTGFILLYFHNPECTDCKIVKEEIVNSLAIQNLLDQNKLKILSIYPDENLITWQKHYDELPSNWINAYDKGSIIKNKELYDLKAIPTIYLLDKQKKVLLKDARFEEIEQYILKLSHTVITFP